MARRLLLLLLLVAMSAGTAAAVAGCGGSGQDDPRSLALSYLPRDAPIVAVAQTDPTAAPVRAAMKLASRFPGGGSAFDGVRQRFSGLGVDFDADVKPLLGNPAAFAAPPAGDRPYRPGTLSLAAKDPAKLKALVAKVAARPGARRESGPNSSTLVTLPGAALAQDGSVLLVDADAGLLRAAIERHGAKSGFDPKLMDQAAKALPQNALVLGSLDARTAARSVGLGAAAQVPWFAALARVPVALTPKEDGLEFDARPDTSRAKLEPDDVPLVSGAAAPDLPRDPRALVGVRDLSHVIGFALRGLRAASPDRFAQIRAGSTLLRLTAGVDLENDLLARFRGSASATLKGTHLLVRADTADPAALGDTLQRLRGFVPRAFDALGRPGVSLRNGPAGFTEIVRDKKALGAYGIVGKVFAAGTGTPEELKAFASLPVERAAGAQGAGALSVPAGQLATYLGGFVAPDVLRNLGDARGWVRASPQGMVAHLRVAVR